MINDASLLSLLDKIAFVWIHSLWIVAIVAVLYLVCVRFVGNSGVRYQLGIVSLLAAFVSPFLLLLWEEDLQWSSQPYLESGTLTSVDRGAQPGFGQVEPENVNPSVSMAGQWEWKATLAFAWIAGATLFSLRFLFGALQLRGWKKRGRPITSPEVLRQFEVARDLVMVDKVVRLISHPGINVPITFGWLSPVLVVPTAAVTGLPAEQMQSILVHELVHIRKNDYLISLFQALVETVFFYHPLVWWISHRIRIDREFACDDEVIGYLENRITYANALVEMETLRQSGEEYHLAPGAVSSRLADRIKSILHLPRLRLNSREWFVVPVGVGILLVSCVSLWFAGTVTANAAKGARNFSPAPWFPSETKGKEVELVTRILERQEDELKHLAFAAVVDRWIKNDPNEAVGFISEQKDPRVRQTFFLAAGPTMVENDPGLLLEIVNSGQWWPDQYYHVNQAIPKLASQNLDRAIDQFCGLREKYQSFLGARSLAKALTERNGHREGLAFAEKVSSPGGKAGAVRGTIHVWVQKDEPAVIAHVLRLRKQSDRATAIRGILAGKGRNKDPKGVLDWTKKLSDEDLRNLALVNLAWLWALEKNQEEVNRILDDRSLEKERGGIVEGVRDLGIELSR